MTEWYVQVLEPMPGKQHVHGLSPSMSLVGFLHIATRRARHSEVGWLHTGPFWRAVKYI